MELSGMTCAFTMEIEYLLFFLKVFGYVFLIDNLLMNLYTFLNSIFSDITLNITDFYQNVLKTTTDTQYIRGPWTFNEIRILGNKIINGHFSMNLSLKLALSICLYLYI